MKYFCSRMACILCLAVFSSFTYATKNTTGRNTTAVAQLAAVFSNLTAENGTVNSTAVYPHLSKHQKPKLTTWLQGAVNGTHARRNTTTHGYQGQPSSGAYAGKKGSRSKGSRNKDAGRRGRTDTPESASKTGGSRNTTVDESFTAQSSPVKLERENYRPHSRNARRGYTSGKNVTKGDSGNGLAKGSDIPVKKAGHPMAKSPLPAKLPRPQRNIPEQPPMPVGNANFTEIVGRSHNGHFHLVEPVNLDNHTPFHNTTAPFSGELDGRGHAITGLNAPLFEAVDGSHLDLVFVKPNVTGNPAGAVASQMGSNNEIKVKVIDGNVTCNETINCNVGLIGGEIRGHNNYIEQYNSTGYVRAETGAYSDTLLDSGGVQIASLSVGSVKGSNNTLVQKSVSGSADVTVYSDTSNYESNGSSLITNGTVAVASAGPGYMAGEGNTVIQEKTEATVTSRVSGIVTRYTPGIAIGAKSLVSLGGGIVEGDQFTLQQTKVRGGAGAYANGHTSNLDIDCHFHHICPDTDAGSIVRGVLAVATTGVAETKGNFLKVSQIDTEAHLEAQASDAIINNFNPNNTVPAAAYKGAIVGRYDSEGGLLQLYSGSVSQNVPLIGNLIGGNCSADSFIDRPGYMAGESAGCNIQELNTTRANPNLVAWQSLCVQDDVYQCDNGRSCHYVHEGSPSLVSLPNGDLALLSQQSYPYGSEADNANGVFRVTQYKAPSGTDGTNSTGSTGNALPQLNENIGYFGTTVYEAEVPQGKRLSLPVSQHANSTHIHNLYERNGGLKIASFPITKTGGSEANVVATTYYAADFDVPGRPLFIGDNGSSVWVNNGITTIDAYHYDGRNRLNLTASFNLLNSPGAGDPVLAAGHNSDWLYVARYLDADRVQIVRFSMADKRPDSNFYETLKAPGTGINYELSVDKDNNVILLPRGTVHLAREQDNGNTSTNGIGPGYHDSDGNFTRALKVVLPRTGGCVNWKIVEAYHVSAGGAARMTAVVPEPSSSTVLSTVGQMTTNMSSLPVTPTPKQALGTGKGGGSDAVDVVKIAVPAVVGGAIITVGTAVGVYCIYQKVKQKRRSCGKSGTILYNMEEENAPADTPAVTTGDAVVTDV